MSISRTFAIPANPTTKRGTSVHLSYDKRTNRIAYASGKSIFLRSVDDTFESIQYTGHNYTTTAATFSPSGYYVASGDESGMVKVWDCSSEDLIEKGEFQVISGRINAIAWDADSKRIIAVGDGKERYGHCFTFDSGNTVGEVSGHSAQVNAVSIRSCRPYRAATVSDDGGLVFLQGPPFKFAKSVRGHHSNFVRDVKFSPDGDKIVAAGADRSITVYDGKSGDHLTIVKDAHDGGIFGVDWYDDKSFVTCSADSSVKLWDAEGNPVKQWQLKKSVQNQLLGVVRAKDYVIALALSGDLYYFDESSESPVKVVYGHQKSITALSDAKYSGSYDGRIISWDLQAKAGTVVGGDPHTNLVVAIKPLGSVYVTAGWDDKIKKIDGELSTIVSLDAQPIQLASGDDSFAVITDGTLGLYDAKGEGKPIKLDYTPSSVAVTSKYVIVTDAIAYKINVYDHSLGVVSKTLPILRAKPTYSAVSPNEKYLAVGDSTGKIFCIDLETDQLVTSRWSFHTSSITGIAWHTDNDHVLAGSLDTDLIVYSVSKPARKSQVRNTHKEGISAVGWVDESTAVTGGADSCVKFWKVEFA